jgi:hypothetical protein
VAGMLFAQQGEGSFDEIHGAKEDNLELVAHKILGGWSGGEFLYCADNR